MFDDRPADPLPGSLAVEGCPGFATELPGVALASVLEQADLDALGDAALVEVVAGWRRLQSWAAARSARAAAALSERASMNPYWPSVAGDVREPCVAGEELALRLGCSRRAARDLVRSGKAYDAALWPTGDALERGEIDEGKARLLVRALTAVPGEVAVAVQEDVLPRAPRRTHSELAADIQRSLIRVDPDDAAERVSRATSERRVCRPTVLPDGMAGIWAVLPAPAAVALDAELDAVARRVRGVGDGRTLDQLRADALCLAVLARGSGAECAVGSGAGGCGIHITGRRSVLAQPEGQTPDPLADALAGPPLAAQVNVTVPLDVLCGLADGAGELAGYGPISSATAEALARGGTWRRLVTDPLSGTLLDVGRTRYRPPPDMDAHVRTRDGTCVRPGCPTSAWSATSTTRCLTATAIPVPTTILVPTPTPRRAPVPRQRPSPTMTVAADRLPPATSEPSAVATICSRPMPDSGCVRWYPASSNGRRRPGTGMRNGPRRFPSSRAGPRAGPRAGLRAGLRAGPSAVVTTQHTRRHAAARTRVHRPGQWPSHRSDSASAVEPGQLLGRQLQVDGQS